MLLTTKIGNGIQLINMQPNEAAKPSLRYDAFSTGEFVRIVEAGFDYIDNEMCKFWFFASIVPAKMQILLLGNVELRASTVQFVLASAVGNPRWRNIKPERNKRPTNITFNNIKTVELASRVTVPVPKMDARYNISKSVTSHQQFPDSVLVKTESSNSKVIWKLVFLVGADPEHSYQGNFEVEFHKSARLVRFQYEIDPRSISVVKLRGYKYEPAVKPDFLNMLLTILIQNKIDNLAKIIFNKAILDREISYQKCFS